MKIKLTSRLYYLVFVLLAVVYLLGFYFREPNLDEGIIAEWAYWLANTGVAKSVLYTPMQTGTEHVIYVYHKLFTWLGALLIKIFGMELMPLRLMVLSFLIVLLAAIKSFGRYFVDEAHQKLHFFVATVVLLCFDAVFRFSFTFRPEIMLSALGFLSFLFAYRAIKELKPVLAAISGLFAALGFLTHLNGIAFLVAGFVFLLWHKQYKAWFLYCVMAGFVSLFIFADDISSQFLSHFLQALNDSPDTTSAEFVWYGPILKIINEHQRFFHSPIEISLTVTLIAGLVLFNKLTKQQIKPLLQYTLILIIALGSLTHGKTAKYLLLIVPFMVLIISHFVLKINELNAWKRNIFTGVLILYFVVQGIFISQQFYPHHNVKQYGVAILENIPKSSKVLGNSNLVFAGVGEYHLHADLTFEFIADQQNIKKNIINYLDFANKQGEHYVVFTKMYTRPKYWNELMELQLKPNSNIANIYNVFYISADVVILKQVID